jgi:hydrogenase small subunit
MYRLDTDLRTALDRRGITRAEFLRFCAGMVATLALPPRYTGQVSKALQRQDKPVLVWLEFQDCAGNSESMLRASHPPVADVVLETLSWEYHELLMAGSGKQAEAVLDRVVREQDGQFLAIVEGSIPTADGGVYCTIAGRTALDIARQVCTHAAATIAVGACAWDGGLVRQGPTGAVGVQQAVPGIKIVNLGGCPHNPANTAAVIVHYLTFGELPALDQYNRPLFAYGDVIHDQCERRAHYDAGRFVEEWGDEGSRKGWCLYKMGCKGPQATYNCPTVRWNDQTSWPVQAGHGCIACASPRFWDTMSPFYERLPDVPGNFGPDITAGRVGVGLIAATAVGFAAHGVGSAIRARVRPPETDDPEAPVMQPEPLPEEAHAPDRD